jgi:hypothetical protein
MRAALLTTPCSSVDPNPPPPPLAPQITSPVSNPTAAAPRNAGPWYAGSAGTPYAKTIGLRPGVTGVSWASPAESQRENETDVNPSARFRDTEPGTMLTTLGAASCERE